VCSAFQNYLPNRLCIKCLDTQLHAWSACTGMQMWSFNTPFINACFQVVQ